MAMMAHNIDKIVDGIKTATSREHKRNDGEYVLPDNTIITIKGGYYRNHNQLEDKDVWARAEGFLSFDHMKENATIPAVKEFMNGDRGIYIYRINRCKRQP